MDAEQVAQRQPADEHGGEGNDGGKARVSGRARGGGNDVAVGPDEWQGERADGQRHPYDAGSLRGCAVEPEKQRREREQDEHGGGQHIPSKIDEIQAVAARQLDFLCAHALSAHGAGDGRQGVGDRVIQAEDGRCDALRGEGGCGQLGKVNLNQQHSALKQNLFDGEGDSQDGNVAGNLPVKVEEIAKAHADAAVRAHQPDEREREADQTRGEVGKRRARRAHVHQIYVNKGSDQVHRVDDDRQNQAAARVAKASEGLKDDAEEGIGDEGVGVVVHVRDARVDDGLIGVRIEEADDRASERDHHRGENNAAQKAAGGGLANGLPHALRVAAALGARDNNRAAHADGGKQRVGQRADDAYQRDGGNLFLTGGRDHCDRQNADDKDEKLIEHQRPEHANERLRREMFGFQTAVKRIPHTGKKGFHGDDRPPHFTMKLNLIYVSIGKCNYTAGGRMNKSMTM